MFAFDPGYLFIETESFAARVRVHMRAIGKELGVITGHLSFLRPKRRTRDLDCSPVGVIDAVDVAWILNDVALVKTGCEVVEQVRPDHVVVVQTIVPDSDIVPPVRTWNPANRPDLPDPGTIVAAEQAADAVSTVKNIIASLSSHSSVCFLVLTLIAF